MKNGKRIICAIAVAAWCCGAAVSTVGEPAPNIVCDQPLYDFGKTSEASVTHEFVIRNTGELDLEIEKVRPTCGCTVAKLSRKVIPPGGTASIRSTLSLRGRKGRVKKSIRVESNDPDQSVLNLYFDGEAASADSKGEKSTVKPLAKGYVLAPPELFIPPTESDRIERYHIIQFAGSGPFAVTNIVTPDPTVNAQYTPLADKGYRIKFTIPRPNDRHGQQIVIQTDHTNIPAITLPIRTHR